MLSSGIDKKPMEGSLVKDRGRDSIETINGGLPLGMRPTALGLGKSLTMLMSQGKGIQVQIGVLIDPEPMDLEATSHPTHTTLLRLMRLAGISTIGETMIGSIMRIIESDSWEIIETTRLSEKALVQV